MNNQKMFIAVLAMAIVMLSIKLLPLLFLKSKIKNKFLQSFLAYIPYAVLTSMLFPEVFRCTPSIYSSSIAVLAAIVLAYFGQSLIVVTISSTVVAFIVEQIIKMMF